MISTCTAGDKYSPRGCFYSFEEIKTRLTPIRERMGKLFPMAKQGYKPPLHLKLDSSGVVRICCEGSKDGNGELTVDFRAGCSSCSMTNSVFTNVVLIESAVSCSR